jgi:hypothetical protein
MPIVNLSSLLNAVKPPNSLADAQTLLRQANSRGVSSVSNAVSRQGEVVRPVGAANNQPVSVATPDSSRRPYAGVFTRVGEQTPGFVITTTMWIREENAKYLQFHAGPNRARWRLENRGSDEEIKDGMARYVQSRRSGTASNGITYMSVPEVEFSFQSGNILPLAGEADPLPYGLSDFYQFLGILNQPPFVPGTGERNLVWVYYNSLQLPEILLQGYFDAKGINWTDDASDPAQVSWEARFYIYEMTPTLWDAEAMQAKYLERLSALGGSR